VDHLDAQEQAAYKKIIREGNGLVTHPPEGCTEQCAGVDRGYGKHVKHEFGNMQDDWCEENEENYQWREEGRLSASDRRILASHWLAKAVKKVNENLAALEKYLGHAGLLMTADGSDDELIKLEGHVGKYEFMHADGDDWMSRVHAA